ncbi:MAG: HEAT repeat domain-containing protein, partial [Xenococcaceae cyanobacterium MO_207.B15]|nr:HEAT repeat domain-containing protein [Xenococcaceae cyanobacterium MO_207.B15]
MIEPITLIATWGLTSTAKFVYKSVLEELNKDKTKDWVKDVLQDWLKDVAKDKLSGVSGSIWEKVTNNITRESIDIAAESAITAFLVLINNQLADELGLTEEKRERYKKPLNQFIKEPSVRQILGSPFKKGCERLDIKALKETWDDLGLRDLPDEFNWDELATEYLKIVKKIFHESKELRPLLDFQRQEKDSKNLQEIAGISPDYNLVKYQETICEKYGNLKLESIDSGGYIYDKQLKIYQIFIPQNVKECQEYLPQVYELPKDLQRKLKEKGELDREISQEELERYKRAYTSQQIRSVLEVIKDNEYKYLLILGDPGSGKSTLLQYLAVEWAKLPPKDLPSHPITLLIELRSYIQDFTDKRCNNFLEFIHKGSSWVGHLNQHELDKRLKQGEVRVLFDGLDEVFDPQQRANVIAQIHNFTQTYPQVKVIVTSRIIGYKPQQLKDAEFHHFMLQDLEPEQIADFLQKWHDLTYNEATESQKKQDRQQRITKAIKESQAIQQLAANPLLLTMMAILNRNQDLPRDRAKLYERSSELLLYQWDVEGKLLEDPELKSVDIDYQDKQAMLRDVAHFMQATETGLAGNLISQKDLETVLVNYLQTIDVTPARKVGRLMIEQLRTRNFILCDIGSNYYAFVHRTFLEYFCAWSYIWQLEAQTLSIEQIKTEVFGNHWQDESWYEVLRLIAGMILEPKFVGEIIEYLMEKDGESANFANLFLAADCLAEVRNRKSITKITNSLLEKLKQFAKEVEEFVAKKVSETAEQYKLKVELSQKVINAIANNWKDEPNTLIWLKTCIELDSQYYIRESAVIAIARGWKDDPETLPILKQLAQSDDSYTVRSTAVQELARGWKDDPDTLSILKQLAQSDDSYTVRSTAVQELARGWKDDP